MKKVITVLAILVVLTSAIFAETHKIKIQATSELEVPVFEMSIGEVKTNTNESAFGTENNSSLVKTAVAYTFDFEDGGVAEISVKILNDAKIRQNYRLAFSDGVFHVKRNNIASVATGTENLHVTPTIVATGKSGTGFAALANTDDQTANINFNGTRCVADTEIATATYTYAADDTIDPDTYTADIQLDITIN